MAKLKEVYTMLTFEVSVVWPRNEAITPQQMELIGKKLQDFANTTIWTGPDSPTKAKVGEPVKAGA